MVSILHETDTVEAPMIAAEADETATLTQELPTPGFSGLSLPLRTLHSFKSVDVRVVSIPARRITIEGMRRVTTSRPTADEVND